MVTVVLMIGDTCFLSLYLLFYLHTNSMKNVILAPYAMKLDGKSVKTHLTRSIICAKMVTCWSLSTMNIIENVGDNASVKCYNE